MLDFMSTQEYIGKKVVIDTKSDYLYLGTLTAQSEECFTVEEVDVHDHSSTTVCKEVYIIEAAKYGIKINRKKAKVLRKDVISISLLDDVVTF